MLRIPLQFWIGGFTLLTAGLAGAVIGRWLGLSAGDGVYLMLLILVLFGWLAGRRGHRRGDSA